MFSEIPQKAPKWGCRSNQGCEEGSGEGDLRAGRAEPQQKFHHLKFKALEFKVLKFKVLKFRAHLLNFPLLFSAAFYT